MTRGMQVPIEEPTRKLAAITRQSGMQPFEDAATQGHFMVPRCDDCGRFHWYPRVLCPFCFSDGVTWQQATGRGTIYSYSIMRKARPPYAIAYVKLEEGPTMMTNIVGCDLDSIRIGVKVSVLFQAAENGTLVPMFQPEAKHHAGIDPTSTAR